MIGNLIFKSFISKAYSDIFLCVGPKDVHTELIQHKRSWMRKRGIVKGNLSVDSAKQRLKGSCPLMPEEVHNCVLVSLLIFTDIRNAHVKTKPIS